MMAGCNNSPARLPSLKESYRRTDKLPFGAFIAYGGFRQLFSQRTIEVATAPFDKTWSDIKNYSRDGVYSLYFLLTKNLVLKNEEVTALMEYVKAGNDLFISADYIDKKFLDAIYCSLDRKGEIASEVKGKMHDTHVSMYFGNAYDAATYGYYYFPFLNSISGYDTTFTRILGINEIDKPNYALLFTGRGRIYLHVAPRIFSNYFLLTKNNYHYFENVISYLRLNPKNIYWDEYYQKASSRQNRNDRDNGKDNKAFSSLRVINEHPPLLFAFWLAVAGMVVYVLFNVKRKQKPIDIIKPETNATVAFAETVGRLYLQQKNNGHIADKMITYLYEHIRNKYFISTAILNTVFIDSLSGKSGVSQKETRELFALIEKIRSEEMVTDEALLELSAKIENFKNKT